MVNGIHHLHAAFEEGVVIIEALVRDDVMQGNEPRNIADVTVLEEARPIASRSSSGSWKVIH